METTPLTKEVILKKCRKPLLTESYIYSGCTVLCLGLSLLFGRYLPETPVLYLVLDAAAFFFALLFFYTVLQWNALLKGSYTLETGTVSHKRPQSICDTRAYTLTFSYGAELKKTVRTAEISPAEFAKAKEGQEYLLVLTNIVRPRVLGFFAAETYALPEE